MRKLAPVLIVISFGFGYAAATLTVRPPPRLRVRDDYATPTTIEVYRPATSTLPEVADTIKFCKTGHPVWVVRIRYGTRVVEYCGEAVNHSLAMK